MFYNNIKKESIETCPIELEKETNDLIIISKDDTFWRLFPLPSETVTIDGKSQIVHE